jgi:hypothetical protein
VLFSPSNIQPGFCIAGLWPINSGLFTGDEFLSLCVRQLEPTVKESANETDQPLWLRLMILLYLRLQKKMCVLDHQLQIQLCHLQNPLKKFNHLLQHNQNHYLISNRNNTNQEFKQISPQKNEVKALQPEEWGGCVLEPKKSKYFSKETRKKEETA